MNENINRIWQPVVEPNCNPLPSPASLNDQNSKTTTLFTKTSLASSASINSNHSREQVLQNKIKQYNREVLTASESFNNSPKPFKRATSSGASSSLNTNNNVISSCATKSIYEISKSPLISPTTPSSNNNKTIDNTELCSSSSIKRISDQKQQHGIKFISQLSQVAELSDSSSGSGIYVQQEQKSQKQEINQKEQQQEENMAPKLVHKQYNSPIDLYSMNNIRKTIEAHTELIAPGLKGINFMKPDTPVNKQSEVYKLVMEEERSSRQQPAASSSSRLSPISGQPLSGTRQAGIMIQEQQHLAAQQQQQILPARQQPTADPQVGGAGLQQQQPNCCECGQLIVGPFARIGQSRCIHPQCFNCTTCGTSLKNIGYFTVNDKLYCEIHAKQVANIMRISYDFSGVNQKQEVHSTQKQASNERLMTSNLQQQQQQHSVPSTVNELGESGHQQQQLQFKSYASSSSPATISTMFADRSNSVITSAGATSAGSGEVRWTWRPMTSKERCNTSSSTSTCLQAATTSNTSSSSQQQQQPQYQQQQQHYLHQQQQQENLHQPRQSIGIRGRGLLQAEGSLIGGQIPICVHCNTQIHGPYILAGKTTWCKLCSQNHFNCHSCKRSLLDIGFIEDNFHKYYCEHCFEAYHAPICSKCNIRIKGDCLNALQKQWHPSCFVCGHCRRPFGNSSFYLEDSVPYCERDWNLLFTTKCYSCLYPIQAGDKWIEALDRNYHSNCFRCSSCQTNLEGSTFYCKNNKPYCRLHAR